MTGEKALGNAHVVGDKKPEEQTDQEIDSQVRRQLQRRQTPLHE
jgi:hypothetical protein